MINFVRKIVAGPKNRTVEGEFDLDLTHITERFIAMAFPASGLQKTYRNSIDDVANYLNKQFKGHYMVFNMSMRKYEYQLFDSRVKDYFWPDHQAPPLSVIFSVFRDMHDYLAEDSKNIIVVHCNHGKGRTGTAIIGFFLYTGFYKRPESALRFYNKKRFSTKTYGVDQPCQYRYLNYVTQILRSEQALPKRMKCYRLVNLRQCGLEQDYFLRITQVKKSQIRYNELYFPLRHKLANTPLMSDILIQIYEPTLMGERQMCRINYNLHFLPKMNGKKMVTLQFKGQEIKINNKHDSNFKFQLDFELYCNCHQISEGDKIDAQCGCFHDRKVQDADWKMIRDICEKGSKITEAQAIKLIFNEIDEKEFDEMAMEM